jgi:putative two-component system response regulator
VLSSHPTSMEPVAQPLISGHAPSDTGLAARISAAECALTAGDIGSVYAHGLALHHVENDDVPAAALPSLETLIARCLALCRRLYAGASANVAIPYALAAHRWACALGETNTQQRALTACGLLMADIGNVARAIEYHVSALSLANSCGNAIEASRTWTNIGTCFSVTGNDVLAARCFGKALVAVADNPEPLHSRFAALCNLSLAHFHQGEYADGLSAAERALHEALAGITPQDDYGLLLLHRNMVRLYLAQRDRPMAAHHLEQVRYLASMAGSRRAEIAYATVRGAFEVTLGETDVGLTRLSGALADSRKLPSVLRDTLAFAAWAESEAGVFDNVRRYNRELSDHVYDDAIRKVTLNVALAQALDGAGPARRQTRVVDAAKSISTVDKPAEWDTLCGLATTASLRVDRRGNHGRDVGALTKALAQEVGIAPLDALEVGLASQLHDIGMLSVPEQLPLGKDRLSAAERDVVNRHCDAGAAMLAIAGHTRWGLAKDIAQYHHAHWDGGGYPAGVRGAGIPIGARLCAVADAYDSMVTSRPWRNPMTMDAALAELRTAAGTQLDPDLVEKFEIMLRRESDDIGVDPALDPGLNGFEALIDALTEDRGSP